jgi:hypothetical protein
MRCLDVDVQDLVDSSLPIVGKDQIEEKFLATVPWPSGLRHSTASVEDEPISRSLMWE